MNGGVVYGGGNEPGLMGKWSERMVITAGALPPGTWILSAAATLNTGGGGSQSIPAGSVVDSDGSTVTAGAWFGWLLGERPKPIWPFPKPWPLTIMTNGDQC